MTIGIAVGSAAGIAFGNAVFLPLIVRRMSWKESLQIGALAGGIAFVIDLAVMAIF